MQLSFNGIAFPCSKNPDKFEILYKLIILAMHMTIQINQANALHGTTIKYGREY